MPKANKSNKSLTAVMRESAWSKAQPTILVDFMHARIIYLKQKTGYYGVILPQLTDKPFVLRHHVDLLGSNPGWITPGTATNALAKAEGLFVDETVPRGAYRETILKVRRAILQAAVLQTDVQTTPNILSDINAPGWLSIEVGEITDEDVELYALTGVENALYEYAEVTGQRLVVDVLKFIQAQVSENHISAVEGSWDTDSDVLSKHNRMKTGAIILAKRYGVKLVPAKSE